MDEKLIDAVKKYPCLWDTKLDTYKCNETRDAAWEIIVKETNFKDSKTAKNRWKQLRDSHREVLKRIKSKKSGQAATKKKEWKYEKHMEFLLPYMANRDRTSNYGDETSTTDERNNDDSTQSSVLSDKSLDQNQFEDLLLNSEQEETANLMESIPPPSKKKRSDLTELLQLHRENQKRHQQQRIELKEMLSSAKDDYDEIDHFFLSLAKTTKKFPGYLQARVKRSCFNAVAEAEDSHLYSQHTYGYYTNTGESSSQQNISNSQQFEMMPFSEPQSIQENTNMIPPQTLPVSEPQSIQENTYMIPPQTLPVSEPQSIQENTNMIPPQTLPVSEPQSIQENTNNLTESAPTKS